MWTLYLFCRRKQVYVDSSISHWRSCLFGTFSRCEVFSVHTGTQSLLYRAYMYTRQQLFMMQPTTLALHSPSDAVYELYICRILSASSPTTTYMCCNKQTHYKDLVQKLVMCGIDFFLFWFGFWKKHGFGSGWFWFGSDRKTWFSLHIIVICYSCNSRVVNLQHLITATMDDMTLTSLTTMTCK